VFSPFVLVGTIVPICSRVSLNFSTLLFRLHIDLRISWIVLLIAQEQFAKICFDF
jgi:hypothetical protein